MIRRFAPLAALVVATLAVPAQACSLARADLRWFDRAIANWRHAERVFLRLPPVRQPEVVAIGPDCVARGRPGGAGRMPWRQMPHHGRVMLPDGAKIPVGVVSFAGPSPTGGFFVMSAPSVWRAGGVKSEFGLTALMDGVMLHEIMHTRQFGFVNPYLERLTKRYGLPADINDDSLQEAFEDDQAYAAAYMRERDLLFAAAAAPSDAEARRLAREALAAMRARRARWFKDANAKWAPLDDLFLQMEGLGQWVAYKWYVDGPVSHAPGAALRAVRRGGKWWTQDEGLALMLTVDRLVPGWQRAAFVAQPALAEALLGMAADERPLSFGS